MRDLFVLTADLDMEETMKGLLARPRRLGIRNIRYEVVRHRRRDAGCRADAVRRLRPHLHEYSYAIVVFDKSGCGRDNASREAIQSEVEENLSRNGWDNRAKAIVIEPELETWVWSASNLVPRILGWTQGYGELRTWLLARDLWPEDAAKPPDPKTAMRKALREKTQRVSASLFGQLAMSVSLQRCKCPAFKELKDTLQDWFPKAA